MELLDAGGVPPYLPAGQDVRVLKLTKEDPGCPCVGTLVKSLSEIGTVEITKVKKKSGNTIVSYKISPMGAIIGS